MTFGTTLIFSILFLLIVMLFIIVDILLKQNHYLQFKQNEISSYLDEIETERQTKKAKQERPILDRPHKYTHELEEND